MPKEENLIGALFGGALKWNGKVFFYAGRNEPGGGCVAPEGTNAKLICHKAPARFWKWVERLAFEEKKELLAKDAVHAHGEN